MAGRVLLLVGLVVVGACTRARVGPQRPEPRPEHPERPERTVASVVADLGPTVRARLGPLLSSAGLDYPPSELALLAFKRERRLEIWGRQGGPWVRIDVYPILAASGVSGPKLRQGDLQVPEGFYRLVFLNPNSRFHLSMMLDYPNADDVAEAARAGRLDLGGEIFIHGGAKSIGCLAMGDRAIEDLFVLVADVGLEHVQVIVAPHDPRGGMPLRPATGLPFTRELYQRLEAGLRLFPSGGGA